MLALVTGATGLLGRHLCAALLARGDTVVALTRRQPELHGHGRMEWWPFDLRSPEDTDRLPEASGSGYAAVFHLAAELSSRDDIDLASLHQVNAIATGRLASRAAHAGFNAFIYASSISVYDAPSGEPIFETSPLRPETPYGRSKLDGELAALSLAGESSMKVAALRISSMYGPGMRTTSIIPLLVERALGGEDYGWYGSGTRAQDYIHARDVAAAFIAAAETRAAGAYNIASGVPITNRDLARTIADLTPWSRSSVGACGVPDREEGRVWLLDTSAAADALGWQSRTDLRQGLAEYIDHRRG